MRILPTEIAGCHVVELDPFQDERGFFARAWSREEMGAENIAAHVDQINMILSVETGTIRGLHWRPRTHPESKFVRCIAGRVFDVCVDVRRDSPTYLQWTGVELSAANRLALSIPEGCAHGFQSLTPNSEVLYLVSAPFEPGIESGARWNDPAFGIEWPITGDLVLSDRDRGWPDFLSREAAG